jgi:hypothetical protein
MDEHGEHQDLHSSGHRSVIPYIHGRDECCIAMCMLKSRLSLVVIGLARRVLCGAGVPESLSKSVAYPVLL